MESSSCKKVPAFAKQKQKREIKKVGTRSIENVNKTKIKTKRKHNMEIKDIINLSYTNEKFRNYFNKIWKKEESNNTTEFSGIKGLKVTNKPFNWGFMPNLIRNEEMLEEVHKELKELQVHQKNNDLYKFKCTGDLNKEERPNIQLLCKYIRGPIKSWVQNITGITLNDKVSISCSMYEYSDALLCHDDELEGRRIAFIFYLVPTWPKSFGGSLDLFSVDRKNRPYCIAERIYPEFNSFAFFEVSPVSFHQVSEVVAKNKIRLSVNGWFHGEPIKYPNRCALKAPLYRAPGFVEEHILYAWVNPLYLEQSTQSDIRKEFQEKSEIQLSDFLKTKKYDLLSEALRIKDLKWKWVGPPYKKNYELMSRKDLPEVVEEYVNVMQSEAMFLILSQLTGLELHPLAPTEDDDDNDGVGSGEETEHCNNIKVTKDSDELKCLPGEISTNSCVSKESNEMSSKKRRRRNKSDKKTLKKKKIAETNSESDLSLNSGLGGLEVGWESDMDNETQELNAAPQNETTKAEMTSEIRRWRWGSYSLMRDDDLTQNKDFILDAMLFCNGSSNWQVDFGGTTVYVAKGEKEELLSVVPVPNSLTLVYRDKETFKFTKHINVKSNQVPGTESIFNEMYFEYRELNR